MATVYKAFEVRDSTSTPAGRRITGLAPSWALFVSVATGQAITPTPTITEVGLGVYRYGYDPEGAGGEAVGQIDATPSGTLPGGGTLADSDRYITDAITRDSSRITSGFDAQGRTRPDLSQSTAGYGKGTHGGSLRATEGRLALRSVVRLDPTDTAGRRGFLDIYDAAGALVQTQAVDNVAAPMTLTPTL